MRTFEDNMTRVVRAMADASRKCAPPPVLFLGLVKEAGNGELRIQAAGMDLTREDLCLAPRLRFDWTEDDGSPDLLRCGDQVVLLSDDGQTFHLITRTVRA